MKESLIKCKCEKCGCDYEKPSIFQNYLVETKYNTFYKWSLSFCDKCRREKERESLKALPNILMGISKI